MTRTDSQAVSRIAARPMRYVYVKNGDAVDQVRNFALRGETRRSGPDAFIGDFLQAHAEDEVLVLCRSKKRDCFEHGNIRAESFPLFGPFGVLRTRWSALRIGARILRWGPDRILCGCTGELLWVTTAASRLLGVPIVNSRHNEVIERSGIGRVAMALNRLSIRACSGVVCHGPFLADQVRDLGVAADRTRQFEVDLTDFAAMSVELPAPERLRELVERFSVVFAFIGRIQHDKGVFDLLDAFADLVQAGEARVGLVYVGDGKDLELLRRRVQERDLAGRVLMLGRIDHGQLPSILRHVSLAVTPTRPEFPEGRCMVVLESLVLGVPVVAPDFGPFPYAVQHLVNGLLFEAGSRESLRQNLALALQGDAIDRLREGAARTGRELLASQQSFANAVDSTFAAVEARS
ncbi:MAG: glycosyltransferase [Steroidobacteraceae bacterium]